MLKKMLAIAAIALIPAAAFAHHGWGSYDAANPITVEGTIETSAFENPHVVVTIKTPEKVWTAVLGPPSRMNNRGAVAELVAVGKMISAYGYKSKNNEGEMRAERITIDGKTVEMR